MTWSVKAICTRLRERSGRQTRRLYRATDLGKTMLEDAREKVRELFGELFEEQ